MRNDNYHGELFEGENQLIYGGDYNGNYERYFYDFTDWWEIDDEFEDFAGVDGFVGKSEEIGYHECVKSALYDDMEGYIDIVQHECELPDNAHYIVCYYQYDHGNLLQLVDFDISKQEIIENVKAQKYVEGADYYLMETMKEFIE